MSFSSEVKAELCRTALSRRCCAQAEAYGVLLYCNQFTASQVRISTESNAFAARLPQGGRVDKEQVLAWKEEMARRYAPSTVNSMIAALNGFFAFQGWHGCRVKALRQQREIFREKARELDKGEYLALLAAARRRGSQRLYHVMQTLGATGIRVSELVFVTVEALAAGRALVHCKGKRRAVLLPQKLCRALQGYCRARGITAGPVFVTRTGRPVDRSNLWREMQALCSRAGVEARKVFPHNFRHLFARAFYALDKDLAKLADLLGHASIETTRIYILESGAEHKRQVERLGLIL